MYRLGVEESGDRVGGIKGVDYVFDGFVVQTDAVHLCQRLKDEVLMKAKVSDQCAFDSECILGEFRRVAETLMEDSGGQRWDVVCILSS
jgi:hypothetical protein